MPLTVKQKERRDEHRNIGGSDLAAVVGVDPFQNAGDVWLKMTGQLKPTSPTDPMLAGTLFEDGVLQWAEGELGAIRRNQYRSRPDLHIATHADAILCASGAPIEAKTAGLFGPLSDDWGDAGTDQVPESVWVQAHGHMIVAPAKICHVPAFLGGRGFCMFYVAYDDAFGEQLKELCPRWWRDHVEARVPPPADVPHLETLKRRKRREGDPADIPGDLLDLYLGLARDAKEAKQLQDEAKAALVNALGTVEWGRDETGRLVTYHEQSSRRVDTDKLKALGLYHEFSKTSTFPVLRFPKTAKRRH